MKLRARAVPYSSVVGSSVVLTNEEGEVVAQLAVMVPNPTHDYKAVALPLTKKLVDAINRADIVV